MRFECLPLKQQPHLSRLALTYQSDFSRLKDYYEHPPTPQGIAAAAAQARAADVPREKLVAALRAQNRAFGADSSVMRNLDRLASGAVAVVTGQQTGLFTGPAYALYKALSVLRWSAELNRQGTDAVPIFWMASEDHDLAEVDHCDWSGREGLERIELPHGPEADGRRVGDVALGPGIEAARALAEAALDGPAADVIAAALRECYVPGTTYSGAFAGLMTRILAGRGLILLDPIDPAISTLAARVMHRAVQETAALSADLQARSKALERAGFHAQVKVTPASTLLFAVVDGKRLPLRQANGGYQAGSRSFSLAELEAIAAHPGEKGITLSASALLRPVVQDALLPTAVFVVGPAELAYLAQSQVVYRRLLGRMPVAIPRADFTLVEPHVARLLRKYRLQLTDVLRGPQHLRRRLELESVPRALARQMSTGERNLRRYLQRIRRPLRKLDATLEGALDTSERKMLYQMEKLRARAGRAADRRAELLDRHQRILRESLAPHGEMQSRNVCALPLLARHGLDVLDALEAQVVSTTDSPGPSCHQIVYL